MNPSMPLSRPKAVIFDWDNTLVDTWPCIGRATNITLEAMGHKPWTPEEVKARVAGSLRDTFPQIYGARWEEAREIYYKAFAAVHLEMLRALPCAEEMLREVFNHRTKAVVFNNPLNPAAVVYPREDLELLARFCREFDAIAICDEVWEHVVFDGREHVPLIAIPGMRERTLKIGSAGKIFGLTGWKIGFVCAAPPLLRVAAKVHQFLTFTTAPNLQVAVAYGLGKPAEYFHEMRKDLARSRDRLTKGLQSLGFPVLQSQGTYFLTVDLSPLGLNETDEAFCRRIVTDYKVAAIPVSAFYEQDAVTSVVRFCFAKKDATLDTALERLSDAIHRR